MTCPACESGTAGSHSHCHCICGRWHVHAIQTGINGQHSHDGSRANDHGARRFSSAPVKRTLDSKYLRGSHRVDENALERAMIAYQRAIDQLEGVIMGKPHAEEATKDSAFVELIAGEALVVNDELSQAIQDCSRLLADVTGTASTLMNHLTGLLAEQRAQFSTAKVVVQDQIGTV